MNKNLLLFVFCIITVVLGQARPEYFEQPTSNEGFQESTQKEEVESTTLQTEFTQKERTNEGTSERISVKRETNDQEQNSQVQETAPETKRQNLELEIDSELEVSQNQDNYGIALLSLPMIIILAY